MIAVDRLTTALRVLACSTYVKDASPISGVLVAPSDAGKSELLTATLPPNARVVNDFTTASMITMLSEPQPPSWIVVPDFNSVISHKPAVAQLTMAFLLSLLAEGITEIPGVDAKAKLQAKLFKNRGIRIALLTGMTPEMFYSRRGKWRATGLLRRLLPINYTYSEETSRAIQDTIRKGVDQLNYTARRQAKLKSARVAIPSDLANAVQHLSEYVTREQLVWNVRDSNGHFLKKRAHEFPFSLHKSFRVYIRAHALLHGRATATRTDFDALKDFSRFVRYDRPEEL